VEVEVEVVLFLTALSLLLPTQAFQSAWVAVLVLAVKAAPLVLDLTQLQAAAQAEYGIQLLRDVLAAVEVVAEIHQETAVALEYQLAQELQVKDFQADQVYVSTMMAKIHTMVVVGVALAAQDWPHKTKINNKQLTVAQAVPVTLWELYCIGEVAAPRAHTFAMAVVAMAELEAEAEAQLTMYRDLGQDKATDAAADKH
jgi:hypothetical protein